LNHVLFTFLLFFEMTMSSRQISKFIWYILSYLWTIATFLRKYIIIEQNICQPDLLPPFFSLSLLFFFNFFFIFIRHFEEQEKGKQYVFQLVIFQVVTLPKEKIIDLSLGGGGVDPALFFYSIYVASVPIWWVSNTKSRTFHKV
jgi:hypothetical protein